MNNARLLKVLDYVPLIAIFFFTVIMFFWEYTWVWSNYMAVILMPVAVVCFYRNHQLGVIVTMFILLLGLFGVIRLSPGISTFTFGVGKSALSIPGFQPQYLLGIIIQFIISRRYFFGIGTKKYWIEFRHEPKDKN